MNLLYLGTIGGLIAKTFFGNQLTILLSLTIDKLSRLAKAA